MQQWVQRLASLVARMSLSAHSSHVTCGTLQADMSSMHASMAPAQVKTRQTEQAPPSIWPALQSGAAQLLYALRLSRPTKPWP